MLYDTLKMVQRLDGPFTREQATALTEALVASVSDTVATKGDLMVLRSELKGEIAGVRNEIAGIKSDMIKWIVGALVFNLLGTAGLIITLTKALAR